MTITLPHFGGSGSALPFAALLLAGISTIIATGVSAMSIILHLKNYRKPMLQRMVVRIMLMVPLYAISSFISLLSLQAAFFIDVVRDIYEAFVIYCFFGLLIGYLGGERSMLILLHGRPPKYPVFPTNLFWREVDPSDPYTFLFLKRGIIQYVQVKPILAVATVILKITGKYNEGDLRASSGYLYVSIIYNISICLALYCLAIFWMCVHEDLKPFRPMPKFLCVKGILFFSFWQGLFISILVAAGAITKLGPYTDREHISLGLSDMLICFEMPFFALAHMYAFAPRDYVDPHATFVARLPFAYAARDAFGLRDVVEDCKRTLRGEGMDYRAFEPSEGHIHQGAGRDRRIRAGLRYAQGGRRKYWLPRTAHDGGAGGVVERIAGHGDDEEVYAPLLQDQAEDVVHTAVDLRSPRFEDGLSPFAVRDEAEGDYGLPFGEPDDADEELFAHSRKYVFGDYLYPAVDVSSEHARKTMWDEEERILRDERGAYFSPILGPARVLGKGRPRGAYGAVDRGFRRAAVRERNDSDVSEGSRRKGKTREVVIDKEADRAADPRAGEVHMGWTKSKQHAHVTSPRIRTLSRTEPHSSPSRAGSHSPASSGSPNTRNRPPPSPREETERPVLPPDAVDLVVEDRHAAEEAMAHERRKGEPAVRNGGLQKVFRRGFVVEDEEADRREVGEVEVEDRPVLGVGDVDDADDILEAEDQAVEEAAASHDASGGTPIARATTPPGHARFILHDIPADENPWA
ncbi:hypothetical protein CERSUDRAFT_88023 [Gelatoporia subvermispora B]|uniref:DUF300-domain-containing protein n=1 Tax=Ceriporiopsis subvermispora (strain B) TaxID=914234 RepID=M2R0K6_CERS8|nr:hypothetical protein CERSUDRAFT_88023 [Gelatoporia subvermispora B]